MKKFFISHVMGCMFTLSVLGLLVSCGDPATTLPTNTLVETNIMELLILTNTNGEDATGRCTGDEKAIVIDYTNDGWVGTNAGWDESECLASPAHTLDYAKDNANRTHNGVYQFDVFPKLFKNNGERIGDTVCQNAATDGTDGDLSELWITWDTNYLYVAVKGEMRNGYDTGLSGVGNNLMVLFDRIPNVGATDFSTLNMWSKAVYTSNFCTDMFVGLYGGWGAVPSESLGGAQLCIITNESSPVSVRIAMYSPATPEYDNTNNFVPYYNGTTESDTLERVFVFRISLEAFTNTMPNLSSVTLKVMAVSVDGKDMGNALTYDSLPDCSATMTTSAPNILDNYFLIPFTDSDGNILTNVVPRYDSRVRFLPGSLK